MRSITSIFTVFLFMIAVSMTFFFSPDSMAKEKDLAPGRTMARQAVKEKKLWITADHSKYDILKKEFKSGPEVTMACLSCHTEAALQFHKTIHWTWLDESAFGKKAGFGKAGLSINNF